MRVTRIKKEKAPAAIARNLRQNRTDADGALWAKLRDRQVDSVKFRRQQPIGSYVVDFVSLGAKLIAEVDGSHHYSPDERKRDELRTKWLEEKGYRVIRFWDNEVLTNINGVFEIIRETVGPSPHPHPGPLPTEGEGNVDRPSR